MVLSLLALAGCDMPDTPGSEEVASLSLERGSYTVPGSELRVSYLRRGDPAGQRVIFVHGTPGDASGWARLLAAAPPGVEYVAIDRPGFGDTQPADAVTSLSAQAAAIAPLLQPKQGRWPIVVGHSLGGPVAAQLALDQPGRVEALVLLAGSFDPAQEHVLAVQRMGEWPGIRSALPTVVRNANLELMALKPQLERLAPRLATLRCPVVAIQGTADRQVPFANLAFLRAHVPSALLKPVALDGANHFIPWERQQLVEEILAELLAEPRHAPC